MGGKLNTPWKSNEGVSHFNLGVLSCCAEELEDLHGVIIKRKLIQLLTDRGCFKNYHAAKEFALENIEKALLDNRIYEVVIYHWNTASNWEYCLCNSNDACVLACAKQLHDNEGFFSRGMLIEALNASIGLTMPQNSLAQLVGEVLSSGLEAGCFSKETAYRFKCPVVLTPHPCTSEVLEDLSSQMESFSAMDIKDLNTYK